MLKRRTPIKKVSDKKAKITARLHELKLQHGVRGNCDCGCGYYGYLEQAHLCRRTTRYEYDCDPRNLLYLSPECHDVFDNGTMPERKDKLPNFEQFMDKMREFDLLYYNRFVNLNG